MKRYITLMLAILMIVSVFAGCGKNDDQDFASVDAMAVYDPEEPTTIVMAEFQKDRERSETLRLIADKFEYDHPNVKIEIIAFPESADEGRELLGSRAQIDIYEVNDHTSSIYINAGLAAEMTEYFDEADGAYTMTIAANWLMFFHDPDHVKAYMVPSSIHSKALYYRADLLEKEGISIPRFFETVEQFGTHMMETGNSKYGLVLPLGEESRYQLVDYFIWSNVGLENIADKGNAYFVKDESSQTVFSLPQAEDALETLKTMYDSLGPEEALYMDDLDAAKAFADGETFMAISESTGIPLCETAFEDEDWVVYPLPIGTSQFGIFSNSYEGWSLKSNSPNEKVAAAFLVYLSNVDNNTYLTRQNGSIPIHSDAIEMDGYFSDSHFSGYQFQANQAAMGLYHYMQPPKGYAAFEKYEEGINRRYEEFFRGEVDAKTLLSELDEYWKKAYEDEGQLWASTPPPAEDE